MWDAGEYGTPGFLGRHRIGVTNWLTTAARFEATADLASGGMTIVSGLPIGQLEVSAAGSAARIATGESASGAAGEARLTFASRRLGGGAAVKGMTEHYATVSLRPDEDRMTMDAAVFVGVPFASFGSLNIQERYFESRSGQRTSRTSGAASFRLLRRSTLSVTASHSRPQGKPAEMAVFAGITVSLGGRDAASAGHTFDPDGGGSSVVSAQRSLPQGTGYGYRVSARRDVPEPGRTTDPSRAGGNALPDVGSGALQAQTGFGRYELGATGHREGSAHYSANVAGGIVAVGGGVYATRPVQQGFALVRVPGVQGVRVLASNQEVGRTNRNGNLLIPNLLPFYGNRLAIEDQDVPMDFELTETTRTVAPPHRGAAVVTFPIRRIQAVVGVLKLRKGNTLVVPAFAELSASIAGAPVLSPVGKGGEFYFESLPAGRHSAELRFRGETCRFTLNVPGDTSAPMVDLGTLTCVSR